MTHYYSFTEGEHLTEIDVGKSPCFKSVEIIEVYVIIASPEFTVLKSESYNVSISRFKVRNELLLVSV